MDCAANLLDHLFRNDNKSISWISRLLTKVPRNISRDTRYAQIGGVSETQEPFDPARYVLVNVFQGTVHVSFHPAGNPGVQLSRQHEPIRAGAS